MVEEYELIITFSILAVLFIIFLIVCLHQIDNGKIENVEPDPIKIEIEDRCFQKIEESYDSKKEKKKKYKERDDTKISKRITQTKIPKRIIQTYFSRSVPERMYNASLTFKELNPDYEYIFYDDDQARKFLKENFDDRVVKAFDILIPGAYKADLFRICELYINGGYYADIFMENLKELSYFDKYAADCILVKDYDTKSNIYNAFMACKKKDPLIENLIRKTVDRVLNKNKGNDPLDVTGPVFIGKEMLKYLNVLQINNGITKYSENKKLLILEHKFNGPFVPNYVCDKEYNIIQTKYNDYHKDRPKMSHYGDLYTAGKIFK